MSDEKKGAKIRGGERCEMRKVTRYRGKKKKETESGGSVWETNDTNLRRKPVDSKIPRKNREIDANFALKKSAQLSLGLLLFHLPNVHHLILNFISHLHPTKCLCACV